MFNFTICHIGWITTDIELFERFWCKVLNYQVDYIGSPDDEMMTTLFNIKKAEIRRYKHPKNLGPDIELHYFAQYEHPDLSMPFYRFGINHICLMVDNTREEWLNNLPPDVKRFVYHNPRGWDNIFIQDYEGNWIELKQKL